MKLRRKLFASALAVAACAATLTTSTYAWYTSNTEVSASNITGASAATGDSSIFISGDNTHWYAAVDASSNENDKITVSSVDLVPCQFVTDGFVNSEGTTVAGTFVTFTLYFKSMSGVATNIGIKSITVENTTYGTGDDGNKVVLPNKLNLMTGQDYSVNILEALAMKITSATAPAAAPLNAAGYSLTPGTGCVTNASNAKAYKGDSGSAVGHYYAGTKIKDKTAHTYLDAISTDMGAKVKAAQRTSSVTALTANTILCVAPADSTSVSMLFAIYIDGADVDCFDACKGQSFKVNLDFKVVA